MSEPMRRRYLVTGANRGLGLEFVRQWLEGGGRVHALARRPDRSQGLEELKQAHGAALSLVACDVADDASVDRACRAVADESEALDVVLNNAGIYGSRRGLGLADLDLDEVRQVLEVNTLGVLRVTRAFLPLLRLGERPVLAHITSLMGSIADNTSGSVWSYRLSKAALNMASRNLAHELAPEGIPSVLLHPGWVRTEMGGESAPLEIADAVASMVRTLDRVGPENTGRFLDRDGNELPW